MRHALKDENGKFVKAAKATVDEVQCDKSKESAKAFHAKQESYAAAYDIEVGLRKIGAQELPPEVEMQASNQDIAEKKNTKIHKEWVAGRRKPIVIPEVNPYPGIKRLHMHDVEERTTYLQWGKLLMFGTMIAVIIMEIPLIIWLVFHITPRLWRGFEIDIEGYGNWLATAIVYGKYLITIAQNFLVGIIYQ